MVSFMSLLLYPLRGKSPLVGPRDGVDMMANMLNLYIVLSLTFYMWIYHHSYCNHDKIIINK
jgi:hypothetical protein